MAILEYEIGGNEIRTDSAEAIADIPNNRALIINQLTNDEPIKPEIINGLTTIEEVFAHFKPQIKVEFQNQKGESIKEDLRFENVGDFNIKNLTAQSPFLRTLNEQKEFYETLIKQIRSNKVLQKALSNADSKAAFITALEALKSELETEKN